MLIIHPDFVLGDTTAMSASSAATSMPASYLRIRQPSIRWRGTTISDTPYIQASLRGGGAAVLGYDTIAVVGYQGALSRNWHREALDFNPSGGGGTWSLTNVATPLAIGGISPPGDINAASAAIAASATAATYLEQTFNKPGKGSDLNAAALSLRTSILVKQNTVVDDLDLRIHVYSTITTQEAQADFDISAGTAGSGSDAGSFSADSTSITDLGGGWYLCSLSYTTDTADTLTIRFQLLDSGGTTITVGDYLYLAAAATMLQTAETTTTEHPVTKHVGTGPMFQVRLGTGTLPGNEVTAARTGWKHAVMRNKIEGFERYGFYHRYTAALRNEEECRIELWDPYNENTYIEAGRMIVGRAQDLGSYLDQIIYDHEETTDQDEADDGELFRSHGTIRRRITVQLHFMAYETAMDSIARLGREIGASRQILAIIPERVPETAPAAQQERYAHENMIYGYVDRIDPIPRVGKDFPDHWNHNVTFVESL